MDLYFKSKISLPGGKLIMKKSVILLISCICIISIVIVAFFGVSAQNISPIIYITSVEILDMDGNEIPGNVTNPDSKSFNITFNPTFENEGVQYMEYVFSTKILPDNATNNSILYSCDSTDGTVECLNAQGGGFVFREIDNPSVPFYVTRINCRSNDGGKQVNDTILLLVDYRGYFGII